MLFLDVSVRVFLREVSIWIDRRSKDFISNVDMEGINQSRGPHPPQVWREGCLYLRRSVHFLSIFSCPQIPALLVPSLWILWFSWFSSLKMAELGTSQASGSCEPIPIIIYLTIIRLSIYSSSNCLSIMYPLLVLVLWRTWQIYYTKTKTFCF